MRNLKLGLIQVPVVSQMSISAKHDILYQLALSCLQEGADIVFFPEAFQYTEDRGIIHEKSQLIETSRAWKNRCSGLAKQYNAYIVPWDYEVSAQGDVYNSSYILDRKGKEVGRFRKVHLTYTEQLWGLGHGDSYPVFDLDFGKVGIMICFDNYWPETAAALARNGAELILYPLYGDTLYKQWEIKMRARAIDHSLYVASCQIDNKFPVAYTGLIDKSGNIVAKLDREDSWKVIDVPIGHKVLTSTGGNPKYKEDIRSYLERCRRPDSYGVLTKEVKASATWQEIFMGPMPNPDLKTLD